MEQPLQILFLEDNEADAKLVQLTLLDEQIYCNLIQVETREEFVAALEKGGMDLILSDYLLPLFNGLDALAIAKEKLPQIPFILVSGVLGEELAIESLKKGATDYVLKHRLSRLAPAVHRALAEAKEHQELQRTSQALLESEKKLRLLVGQLPCIVWTVDRDLKFTSLLGKALADMKIHPEKVIGLSVSEYCHTRDPNFVPATIHERAILGEDVCYEFDWNKRTFSSYVEPLHDSDHKIIGALGIALDITDHKRLEEQLRHTQKMEAIGQLAGGIAHEFNNMMSISLGYCEIILHSLAIDDPLRPKIEAIRSAGERAAQFTRQLFAFSRRQILRPQVFDLNSHLQELADMMRKLLGENISLSTRLVPGEAMIKIDPSLLDQAMMNLVINARDAMPEGGKLVLETSHIQLDTNNSTRYPNMGIGHYVVLTVKDTGSGMTSEICAHALEPFFTTKGPGKGAGLGLSTVYGIIRDSGAKMEFESELEHGTTFRIFFPRHEQPKDKSKNLSQLSHGKGTILLVEDEDHLRQMIRAFLTGVGYTVIEARNAKKALRKFRESAEPIHLLFTDIMMPGMNGIELAQEIKSLNPHIQLLFTTGYTDQEYNSPGLLDPVNNLVKKPYNLSTLAQKIKAILSSTPGNRNDEQTGQTFSPVEAETTKAET